MFITVRGLQGPQSVQFLSLRSTVTAAGCQGGSVLAICSLWGQPLVHQAECVRVILGAGVCEMVLWFHQSHTCSCLNKCFFVIGLHQSAKVANKVIAIWNPSRSSLPVSWGLKKHRPGLVGSVELPGLGIGGELQCYTLE